MSLSGIAWQNLARTRGRPAGKGLEKCLNNCVGSTLTLRTLAPSTTGRRRSRWSAFILVGGSPGTELIELDDTRRDKKDDPHWNMCKLSDSIVHSRVCHEKWSSRSEFLLMISNCNRTLRFKIFFPLVFGNCLSVPFVDENVH